jgi:hypothetical protein
MNPSTSFAGSSADDRRLIDLPARDGDSAGSLDAI